MIVAQTAVGQPVTQVLLDAANGHVTPHTLKPLRMYFRRMPTVLKKPIHQVSGRFFTYNYLNAWLPKYEDDLPRRLLRSAVIGFAASFVSDTRRVENLSARTLSRANSVCMPAARESCILAAKTHGLG